MNKSENKSKIKFEEVFLALIIISAFAFRAVLSLKSGQFSSSDAYFNLRQIENIEKSGRPIIRDELSYSGRTFSFVPGMHYLLAGLFLIFGRFIKEVLFFKILLAAIESLSALVAYLIIVEVCKSKKAGLIAAFATAFSPILIENTFNKLSTYSISVPINLLMIYLFLNSEKSKGAAIGFIAALVGAALIDGLVFVTLVGLLMYMVLAESDNLKEGMGKKEILIFSVVFLLWLEFVIFKNALLTHGISIIWRNVPSQISSRYFYNVRMLTIIYRINALAFLGGAYILYKNLIREKREETYLFGGIIFTALGMLWLRLIEFSIGLMMLGLMFALLFAYFFKELDEYVGKTKIAKMRNLIMNSILAILIFTTISASYSSALGNLKSSIESGTFEALQFLNSYNTSKAVAAAPENGFYIEYFAGKKTIMDSDFLTIKDVNQRYQDLARIYTTPYSIEAIELMEKYDAVLIYLSKVEREEYSISELPYEKDNCFSKIFDNGEVQIYLRKCSAIPISA
ncbi:MAG: hypothetical protein QXW00_01370 [Candidatus Woesearchaeota archaeon]